jgi:hypothetical protein
MGQHTNKLKGIELEIGKEICCGSCEVVERVTIYDGSDKGETMNC